MIDQIEEESTDSFLAYAESLSPLAELLDFFDAAGAELKAIEREEAADPDAHLIDQLKTDDQELRLALTWRQRHTTKRFQDLVQDYPLETDEDYQFLGEMFDEDD